MLNNKANELANAGAHIKDPIIVNHKFFHQNSLGLITWNNIFVIDRNVQKWSDTVIQPTIFNSMINNSKLKLIEQSLTDDDIDWNFTHEWINSNPLGTPCSAKLSKIQGNKMKKCNFTHPTNDIQQRNYLRLYPRVIIPCVKCNAVKDNNEHIGLCTAHTTTIQQIISNASDTLYELLMNDDAERNLTLKITINNSKIFNTNLDPFLLKSHPFYLLIQRPH